MIAQPSDWLYTSIKILNVGLSEAEENEVFFSEDGKTALIMGHKGEHDLFVKLSATEYATAGGKLYWAKMNLGEEWWNC